MSQKKVAVIIGMSRDAIYTINIAKKLGIFVVGIDGDREAEGFKYVDKVVVVDISNVKLVEQVINEIEPNFTIPVPIGRYLSTTGWINSTFNLKGISEEAVLNSTDKYLFHNKLYANRLRNIKMYLIEPAKQNKEEYDITYPAVLKPRYGSGSRNVFYLQSYEELNDKLESIKNETEDYILEEAVEGIEYGVDGAVIEGELKIILLRKKIITPLPIRQAVSNLSVARSSVEFTRVQDKLEQVVKILRYDNCLLHVDLIINEKDVFIIEIAPRPSGHNLHSMFVPTATGVDMVEEYIKFLLGKTAQFIPKYTKELQIRYFDFQYGIINKIPLLQELTRNEKCKIVEWNCQIKEGDYMQQVVDGHSLMGRGYFIIEGESQEDLIKQSQWIMKQFQLDMQ